MFWIFLAFVAAFTHVARNLYQRRLITAQGGRPGLSRDVANAARYWVGFPLSGALLLAILAISPQWPEIGLRPLLFAILGGVFQILATDLLIRLFQRRAFGIGVAYQSTDNLMTALVGPLGIAAFFGLSLANDRLSSWDWLGLVLATLGVVSQSVLTLERRQRAFDGLSLLFGLGCGLAFTVTGVAYSEAVRTLGLARDSALESILAGVTILTIALFFQSLIMGVWIQVKHPDEWKKLSQRAGDIGAIGLFSVLGSFALLTAFGLQHPALVSTVKNLDIPLSVLMAYVLYREMPGRWEWLGMSLIFVSVVMIALL